MERSGIDRDTFSFVSGGFGEDAAGTQVVGGSTVNAKPGIRRGLVQVVGFVALAALPVLALNSLATADTGGASGSGVTRPAHPALTDAQRQCLADRGVTRPEKPADGSRPQLTQEQRDALRQAREACDLPVMAGPGRHPHPALTDAQRQCLADQGVTRPEKPADGSRPQLTQEQRDALRQAREACDLPVMAGPHGPGAGGDQGTA
jgi:hypothetical protein